jgi:hypothetical protein
VTIDLWPIEAVEILDAQVEAADADGSEAADGPKAAKKVIIDPKINLVPIKLDHVTLVLLEALVQGRRQERR